MEDYTRLLDFGLSQTFDEVVCILNQGYLVMFEDYFTKMKLPQYEYCDFVERWNMVRTMMLVIDQLVCYGGGERKKKY